MSHRKPLFILKEASILFGILYAFFLSISFMGSGMKHSFKAPLKHYLQEHAADFTELVSFVIGIIGTSVLQSSSTVTSSLVAFAAETRPMTGNPITDIKNLLFAKRLPGFHRAVATAVVHGMFNAIMVTTIILAFEIPFGLIHKGADWMASFMNDSVSQSASIVSTLKIITPGAWTKPVAKYLLDIGVPGWLLVVLGFILLFGCLKMFSTRMRSILLAGADPNDVETMGVRLIGKKPLDTFLRGLGLTMIVQSSSATTSLVVPLAGMGFFTVRQIFPFIMGANIGTTMTAMMAATAAFGEAGFHSGMTIALCHLLLNTVAVILVAVVPGVYTSIIGCTEWLADRSEERPVALLVYLGVLSVLLPAAVYILPNVAAWILLSTIVAIMLIGPHFYLRNKAAKGASSAML